MTKFEWLLFVVLYDVIFIRQCMYINVNSKSKCRYMLRYMCTVQC